MTIREEITAHYMQFVTSIEPQGDYRTFYNVGERFSVEVSRCFPDLSDKHSTMNIWKKAGFIEKVLPSYLVVNTYYTDIDGNCWGYYNITTKPSEDGKREVIDFDYLLEATQENECYLVAQCIRLCEMDIRKAV
jgi:hypothetical protein